MSVGTTFLSFSVALRSLGAADFGIYVTITGSVGLMTFLDLGLGSGLINELAASAPDAARARGNAVSSVFFAVAAFAALFLALVVAIAYLVNLREVFHLPSDASAATFRAAALLFVGFYCVAMPVSLADHVQRGMHRTDLSAAWSLVANLIQAALIVGAVTLKPTPLAACGAFALGLAVTYGVNFWRVGVRWPELRPRLARVERDTLRKLMSVGRYFFIVSVCAATLWGSDYIILAHARGTTAVTAYAVQAKLFYSVPPLLLLALYPLWPAYAQALARGDVAWCRRVLRISLAASTAIATTAVLGLLVFGNSLARLWVGTTGDTSLALRLGLSSWVIATTMGTAATMFLNGSGRIRPQAMITLYSTVLMLALKYWGAISGGASRMVIFMLVGYVVLTLLPYGALVHRTLAAMSRAAVDEA